MEDYESSVLYAENPTGKPMSVDQMKNLLDASGSPSLKLVNAQPVFESGHNPRFKIVGGFVHDAENPTSRSWSRYCSWRESKCPDTRKRPWLANLNHATLEMVGEIAELTQLFVSEGYLVFSSEGLRAKALDEAGDVLFTATWAMDAWGHNLLRLRSDSDGVELINDGSMVEEAEVAEFCAKNLVLGQDGAPENKSSFGYAARQFEGITTGLLGIANCHFGLTCNALKKLMFQGKTPQAEAQTGAILQGIGAIQRLLSILGYSLEDALVQNIEKLDKRFPYGYALGGGIRQEDTK